MKTKNGEHFKILRLRCAPLRMTNPGFVDSLRPRGSHPVALCFFDKMAAVILNAARERQGMVFSDFRYSVGVVPWIFLKIRVK